VVLTNPTKEKTAKIASKAYINTKREGKASFLQLKILPRPPKARIDRYQRNHQDQLNPGAFPFEQSASKGKPKL